MAQNAFEDNQEDDWIQEVVELEEEKETLITRMEKQDRDAADCVRKLTDALNEEKRKAVEWKNGETPEEIKKGTAKSAASYAGRRKRNDRLHL